MARALVYFLKFPISRCSWCEEMQAAAASDVSNHLGMVMPIYY